MIHEHHSVFTNIDPEALTDSELRALEAQAEALRRRVSAELARRAVVSWTGTINPREESGTASLPGGDNKMSELALQTTDARKTRPQDAAWLRNLEEDLREVNERENYADLGNLVGRPAEKRKHI